MSAGRGVFQPFIHEINTSERVLDIDGIPVLWSLCGVTCSEVHEGAPIDGIPYCTRCYGDPERATDAVRRRPQTSAVGEQIPEDHHSRGDAL